MCFPITVKDVREKMAPLTIADGSPLAKEATMLSNKDLSMSKKNDIFKSISNQQSQKNPQAI